MNNITRVFISYSWDNEAHEMWVMAFANELRKNGIDAVIDKFITQKGTTNINQLMINNIKDSDFTVIIITNNYIKKAEGYLGGVGAETKLLINVIEENPSKVIPVLRFPESEEKKLPFYLKGYTYIDFSDDDKRNEKFKELLYKLQKVDRYELEQLGDPVKLDSVKVTFENYDKSITLSGNKVSNTRKIDINKKINQKREVIKETDLDDFKKDMEIHHLDKRVRKSIDELGIDLAIERYSLFFENICELPDCLCNSGTKFFRNLTDVIIKDRSELSFLINGNIGSGKSAFLSILYYALKKYGESRSIIYINLHSYERLDSYSKAQKKFKEDTHLIDHFIKDKSFPLVLLIDGLNDFNRKMQISSKKWLDDMFKTTNGMNKRIVAIGTWDDITPNDKMKAIINGILPKYIIYIKKFPKYKNYLELFSQTQTADLQITKELTMHLKKHLDEWQVAAVDFRFLCMLMDSKDDISRLDCFSDFLKYYCTDRVKFEILISLAKKVFLNPNIEIIDNNSLLTRHIYIKEFLVGYCLYYELINGLNLQDGNLLECKIIFSENTNKITKELLSSALLNESQKIFTNMKLWLADDKITIEIRMQLCYLLARVFDKKISRDIIYQLLISQWELSVKAEIDIKEKILLQRTIACSLAIIGFSDKLKIFIENLLSEDMYRDINSKFYCNYYAYSHNSTSLSEIFSIELITSTTNETLKRLYGNIKRAINSKKYDKYDLIVLDIATYFTLIQLRCNQDCELEIYEDNIEDSKELLKELFEHKEAADIIMKVDPLKQYLHLIDFYWDLKTPIGILEEVYNLKSYKRAGWVERKLDSCESIMDHICALYYLGLFLLPKDLPNEYKETCKGYDKDEILKTIMLHDIGEARFGDIASTKKNDIDRHREQKLAFAMLSCGAYPELANLRDSKKLLSDFYNKSSINGKIAYELDKIENLIQIYIYEKSGVIFDNSISWKMELRERVITDLGIEILKKIDHYFSADNT